VFFFFPFALEPASPGPVHYKPLPMLPAPSGWRREEAAETAFADAMASAGYLAAGLLRHALISITSSLTALGNQANMLFSQVAAALAFDRLARQAASFSGISWPYFGPYFPQPARAAGLWPAPFQYPAWYSPAAIPIWPVNLWANPWSALTEAFAVWANVWAPSVAQRRPTSSALVEKPPFTATLSVPGFSWSVTLG
jgi:hypothetical protein